MRIAVDLHTHTIASGHAYSTIKEMAQAAGFRELEALAVTDHGLNYPGGPHEMHFANLTALPRYLSGVEILRGVEANIIDQFGRLDMPVSILSRLEVVIAGFHADCGYVAGTVEDNTKAMMAALDNKYVHFICHPGNPDFPVDLEKIAYHAKMTGKALEINNSSFLGSRPGSSPRCRQLLTYLKKYQTLLVLNSDAHIFSAVGEVAAAVEAVQSAGIKEEQILNTSLHRVKNYLQKHKKILQSVSA